MPITGITVQHGEEWFFPCPFVYRISRHCAKIFPYVKENSVLSHPSFSRTQLDSPMLSNPLWILDTIKSSLLHSEFKNSVFVCLFFWAQQLVERKQEKVKNPLFDLNLASTSFIWWSLILVLEKCEESIPFHGTQDFSGFIISPLSCLFFQLKNFVLLTKSHLSALAPCKISDLVSSKILMCIRSVIIVFEFQVFTCMKSGFDFPKHSKSAKRITGQKALSWVWLV